MGICLMPAARLYEGTDHTGGIRLWRLNDGTYQAGAVRLEHLLLDFESRFEFCSTPGARPTGPPQEYYIGFIVNQLFERLEVSYAPLQGDSLDVESRIRHVVSEWSRPTLDTAAQQNFRPFSQDWVDPTPEILSGRTWNPDSGVGGEGAPPIWRYLHSANGLSIRDRDSTIETAAVGPSAISHLDRPFTHVPLRINDHYFYFGTSVIWFQVWVAAIPVAEVERSGVRVIRNHLLGQSTQFSTVACYLMDDINTVLAMTHGAAQSSGDATAEQWEPPPSSEATRRVEIASFHFEFPLDTNHFLRSADLRSYAANVRRFGQLRRSASTPEAFLDNTRRLAEARGNPDPAAREASYIAELDATLGPGGSNAPTFYIYSVDALRRVGLRQTNPVITGETANEVAIRSVTRGLEQLTSTVRSQRSDRGSRRRDGSRDLQAD
jgi:hypothetical protein